MSPRILSRRSALMGSVALATSFGRHARGQGVRPLDDSVYENIVVPNIAGMMPTDLTQPVPVRLVLCMDASGSMFKGENTIETGTNFDIQVAGTVDALKSDAVTDAIENVGGIGITCLTYAARVQHVTGWAFIRNKRDAHRYSDLLSSAILATTNRYGFTYISSALACSRYLLRTAPFQGDRSVVDVSGDGVDDLGVSQLRTEVGALSLSTFARVNGLAICDKKKDMDDYFRENLSGDVWVVQDMENYAQVIRNKISLEIA